MSIALSALLLLYAGAGPSVSSGEMCHFSGARFEYRAIGDLGTAIGSKEKDGFTLDFEKGIHRRGHSGLKMYTCSNDEPFYCFRSSALFFGVPRDLPAIGDEWEIRGERFSAVGSRPLDILGVKSDVVVIASDDRRHLFYYSANLGLLAITVIPVSAGAPEIFFSTTNYGYPFVPCKNAAD